MVIEFALVIFALATLAGLMAPETFGAGKP